MEEKIYHYTDINTVGLILTNKTIRFKRFDLMDDQTETDGLPEMLKKNYFLSCWVLDQKEKIPQWAMYATKGIRLELPLRWYKKFPIPVAGTDQFLVKIPVDDNHPAKDIFFPWPFEFWLKEGQKYYLCPPIDEQTGFVVRVQYDENYVQLKQQNWRVNEEGNGIGLSHIAAPVMYKDAYWSFQDEIRFYLHAGCRHEDRRELPEYIDLPIEENAFKKMKIRLYPNCSELDQQRVIDIVADNFPTLDSNQVIERSDLDGRYKPKSTD